MGVYYLKPGGLEPYPKPGGGSTIIPYGLWPGQADRDLGNPKFSGPMTQNTVAATRGPLRSLHAFKSSHGSRLLLGFGRQPTLMELFYGIHVL